MTFWEQFKQSTILQAVLTIMLWGATIVWLFTRGIDVPFLLVAPSLMTLGWYFGRKDAAALSQLIQQLADVMLQMQQQATIGGSVLNTKTLRQPASRSIVPRDLSQ